MPVQHNLFWSPEERAFSDAWQDASPARRREFVRAVAEARGWTGTVRQSEKRVLHWLDPEKGHTVPAYALSIAVRVFRSDRVLEPLYAAERRMRDSERRRMRKVEAFHEVREPQAEAVRRRGIA